MMKVKSPLVIAVVALIILYVLYMLYRNSMENYDNSGYKWITSGTCASNNLQDLSMEQCSSYLQSSNYRVTNADHGPPGCWLVLGKSLDGVLKENPQFKGKGFGCWSNVRTDGKQCSADFPCVCTA
jgi:hypothetical protein